MKPWFARLNPLSLFDRILYRQYGRLKWRQFIFNDLPNHFVRNRMIFVPKYVPNARDAAPSDVWMHSLQLIGKVTASFEMISIAAELHGEATNLLKISKHLTCDCHLYPSIAL